MFTMIPTTFIESFSQEYGGDMDWSFALPVTFITLQERVKAALLSLLLMIIAGLLSTALGLFSSAFGWNLGACAVGFVYPHARRTVARCNVQCAIWIYGPFPLPPILGLDWIPAALFVHNLANGVNFHKTLYG